MKYIIKIQRNKSFHLPAPIKNHIKTEELDKVLWILNYNNSSVKLFFIKNVETPKDDLSEDILKLYRNIYTYSMIKIPKIVFNYLNCQIFDYIVLNVKKDSIFINTQKRFEISEISGLIKESGSEYWWGR